MVKHTPKPIAKRVGPLTPEMLPIPTEAERARHKWELYQTGPRGGWTDGELPDQFYDELWDLLDRFGGIDSDGDPRLRVVLIDRKHNEPFHFLPVPAVKSDHSVDDHLDALEAHMTNLAIAQENVSREVRLVQLLRRAYTTPKKG